MGNNKLNEQFDRWINNIRAKASEYEHKARKNSQVVVEPNLDAICNEMIAFKNGFNSK